MREDPWARIERDTHLVGNRIPGAHPLHVYWTRRHDGARGVLFRRIEMEQVPAQRLLFRDILIEVEQGPPAAVALYLTDDTHHEVFDLMCRDIIEASSRGAGAAQATAAIFWRVDHWQAMLAEGRTNHLTEQQVRGLMAELWVLEQLALRACIGTAIAAWVAPDDHPQDFALPRGLIEVKARLAGSRQRVSISSLDQLETGELPLALVVIELAPDQGGSSLNEAVDALLARASEAGAGWEERLQLSLLRRGYARAERYDTQRYHVASIRAFAVSPTFPCITRSATDMRVLGVTYSLDLTGLSGFEVELHATIASLLG